LRYLKLTARLTTLGICIGASINFKKGYKPRCNIVKDEKGDLVVVSHSIVVRWKNYFSQLFNVHGVKDVGQAEIHTAEPLVPEPSAFEVDLAIGKLKSHKSSGIDEIPAELIKPSFKVCQRGTKYRLRDGILLP